MIPLLLVALLSQAPGRPAGPAGRNAPGAAASIRIKGNRVFNRETYQALLRLPPELPDGPKRARAIRRRVLGFLRDAGYVLAQVSVRPGDDGRLVLEVDEGLLTKVLFIGTGSFRAIQLKLELAIPQRIFNRPNLERQLAELKERYGLKSVSYELVPTGKVAHKGPQIKDLGRLEGQDLIPARGRYELRIYLDKKHWDTGLDLSADYDFPDGLKLGVGYQGADLLFDRDRFYTGGRAGAQMRNRINGGRLYPALSRAVAEAWWATPPLGFEGFRTALRLGSDLRSRQRSDRSVEIYYRESLEGSLWWSFEIVPGIALVAGGGCEYRILFGVEMADANAPPVEEGETLRPFAGGGLHFVFDPDEPRLDRHHLLEANLRHAWQQGSDVLGMADLSYRKVFGFGWHDLIVSTAGVWIWGAATFDDEEPVGGRHLRGVFGNRYWVERVADLKLEFRFSLARDLFKLSVFHDLAVFGQLDPVSGDETARVADSVGLGFHALILDLFQFDFYYGLGWTSEGGEFDHGLAVRLKKVF